MQDYSRALVSHSKSPLVNPFARCATSTAAGIENAWIMLPTVAVYDVARVENPVGGTQTRINQQVMHCRHIDAR